jgi:hypothetical protein
MTRKYTTLPYTELEVAEGNFDTSRVAIDRIVLHTMVGTWQGAASRFDNSASQVSAHYGVKYDGGLIAWLEEYNTAYHAGSYAMNQRSIGIEHEDMGNYNSPRPDVLYSMSAKLVADICKFYSIPSDSTHIIRHQNVLGASTACPDSLDTDRIIREASAILNGSTPTTDPCASIKAERDRLNGVITGKDTTIASLNQQVATLNTQVATLQTKVSGDEASLLIVKGQLATAQQQALLVPNLQKQLVDSETAKTNYQHDLSACQTQLGTAKTNLIPKSKVGLALYKIAMSLG